MPAHQWRPIRGRRFDPWLALRAVLCLGSAVVAVLALWALASVVIADAAGLP